MSVVELHLDGARAAVIWPTPDDNPHAPPPRVVIYADKVWQFYRFCQPKIPEHRAAWYKLIQPLRLAPGEYTEGTK